MTISKAEVYTLEFPDVWWGGPDKRVRCTKDGKVVMTLEGAQRTILKASRGPRWTLMVAYTGVCGHLHLSRCKASYRIWKQQLDRWLESI